MAGRAGEHLIDVRRFYDPHAGEHKKHDGRHPDIMEGPEAGRVGDLADVALKNRLADAACDPAGIQAPTAHMHVDLRSSTLVPCMAPLNKRRVRGKGGAV